MPRKHSRQKTVMWRDEVPINARSWQDELHKELATLGVFVEVQVNSWFLLPGITEFTHILEGKSQGEGGAGEATKVDRTILRQKFPEKMIRIHGPSHLVNY